MGRSGLSLWGVKQTAILTACALLGACLSVPATGPGGVHVGDTVDYSINGVTHDALWTAQVPAGQINDSFGNPIASHTLQFLIDYAAHNNPTN